MYAVKKGKRKIIIAKSSEEIKQKAERGIKNLIEDESGFWIWLDKGMRRISKPRSDQISIEFLKGKIPLQTLKNALKVKEMDKVQKEMIGLLNKELLRAGYIRDNLFGKISFYHLQNRNIFINGSTGIGKTTAIIDIIKKFYKSHLIDNIFYISAYHLTPELLNDLDEVIEKQKGGEERIDILIIDDLNVEILKNQPQMSSKLLYYIYEINAKVKITISNYNFKELVKVAEKTGDSWIASRLIDLREIKIELGQKADKRLKKVKI